MASAPHTGRHAPARPGPVAAVHRILIATALGCALAYAAWEFGHWARTSEPAALARAALALVVTVGIGVYFRSLRGLRAKLTPSTDERGDHPRR
jgi:hypothetical protein